MSVLLLIAFAAPAWADPLDDETRRIAKGLQCPVCESVSVADSPSELAGQMRTVIRRKLEQGEREQEILAYFTERYGDGVLLEPPRRGFGLLAWFGPLIVLGAGLALLGVLLRGWSRAPASQPFRITTSTSGSDAQVGGPTAEARFADRARAELDGAREEA